jgi:BRCA1-associated protein
MHPSSPSIVSHRNRYRNLNRHRRRKISYGNPSFGTFDGFIITSDESTSNFRGCVVALLNVPPEQVPEGVMNLARSHRNQIEYARIFISSSSSSSSPSSSPDKDDSYKDMNTKLVTDNGSTFHHTMEKWEGSNHVPNQKPTVCSRSYLVIVVLSSTTFAKSFVKDLHQKPYTSLDETQVACVEYVIELEANEGNESLELNNLLSPNLFITKKQQGSLDTIENLNLMNTLPLSQELSTTTSPPPPPLQVSHDVMNCPVCLESLNVDQDFDAPRMLITTVCNHTFHWACLWHCKDSPCPVCRYDHAGLNDTLAQCHKCGATEHNYVCLICGVVSCVDNSHGQEHYQETLHAYALDSETQHVWDFCGQGYVHRLLQNSSDGKLVEVSHQRQNQRLPEAGHLSDSQEGEIVHRKLEDFAHQYYRLLQTQLEQQRLYYQGKLDDLHRQLQEDQRQRTKGSSSAFETLLTALKQEKQQLQQRFTTLQDRYRKVSEEVIFLKNLNESLETNKEQMKHQIQEAQRERVESRKLIQSALPSLEQKLQVLMLQLEQDEVL